MKTRPEAVDLQKEISQNKFYSPHANALCSAANI
jgi:hypothetical protein